jgi:hypothetical protein
MPWNSQFIECGGPERRIPDRQIHHDGQIERTPLRLRLRGVNLM